MTEVGAVVIPLREEPDSRAEYLAWLKESLPPSFHGATIPPDPAGLYSPPPCQVPQCRRVVHGARSVLCRVHGDEWKGQPLLTVEAYVAQADPRPVQGRKQGGSATLGVFEPALAPDVARWELAYGLHARTRPNSGAPMRAQVFNRLAEALSTAGVASVLDCDDPKTRDEVLGLCRGYADYASAFLTSTALTIRDGLGLRDGRYALGTRRGGSTRYSRSQDIAAPWMRELVQRWVDHRVATEAASPQHIGQQEAMVVAFAEWCADEVRSPRDFTRDLLLRWVGYVNGLPNPKTGKQLSSNYRSKLIGAVEDFLRILRVAFEVPVPSNALLLQGERPRQKPSRPRFYEPNVIDELQKDSNLALIPDESHRLVIRIMMMTGVRCGHACALPFDCLLDLNRNGTTDRWALTFVDTKSERAMTLPVPPELVTHVQAHQRRLRDTHAEEPDILFPNPNAYKTGRLAPESVNKALKKWVRELKLKDANGKPVNPTPHRFRHTFATEMLEKGVPIDVVKELLGHRSITTTQTYATVTDKRLRTEWEKAQAVNIRGEVVNLPTGDGADAEWLLHRIGSAVQPLPNGWCGLPIQQECPHANACLDCDNFMTGPEFLPILRAQRDEHARYVSDAEAKGLLRLVEINARPMKNLDRIITTIEGATS